LVKEGKSIEQNSDNADKEFSNITAKGQPLGSEGARLHT
jgi:hypothetical protein